MRAARRIASFFVLAVLVLLAACDRGATARWLGNPDEPLPGIAASGEPPVARSPAASPDPVATLDMPRFAPGQLEEHFRKHGEEMGFRNQVAYLRAAQALARGGPGVETFQRGGDTLYFRESTGEFAVVSERNVIRTYFKPGDGRRYWERQKTR